MPSHLKNPLKARLEAAKRIAVLAIGSDLRKDDAAGLLVGGYLQKKLCRKKPNIPVEIFIGYTAPENLTGQIKRFKPTHLLIVDAAEMGKKPGEVVMIDPHDEGGGASFSTHQLPSKVLTDYLVKSCKCKIVMFGIQPKDIKFGFLASKVVKSSAQKLAGVIADVLQV